MTGRALTGTALLLFFVLIGLLVTAWRLQATLLYPTSVVVDHRSYETEVVTRNVPTGTMVPEATTTLAVPTSVTSVWFTGDVMLSRQVGQFAHARGFDYPWRGLKGIFSSSTDRVVINFEACSAPGTQYIDTQPFRFPVSEAMLIAAAKSGVTHASLANNHALDCGSGGYAASIERLRVSGITPFGHPMLVSSSSVTYIETTGGMVSVLALHTLYADTDSSELESVVASMSTSSALQMAFVHWGNEYEPLSSELQQQFAKTLAHLGIDIIIGHHPHVVQEIAEIDDALVFYSLGNLIFDQYFSDEVERGLVLKLVMASSGPAFIELHPVTSQAVRTQPQFMAADDGQQFLSELADRSSDALKEAISYGRIDLAPYLATSTERVMIEP